MNDKAKDYLQKCNIGLMEFNPNQYADLLKEDISGTVQYAMWNFRERKSADFKSTYAVCVNLMQLVDQTIKNF